MSDKWIEAEGDKPKVERTRQYFAELRASLMNARDVANDLEELERDYRILAADLKKERGLKMDALMRLTDERRVRRQLAEALEQAVDHGYVRKATLKAALAASDALDGKEKA